MSMRGRNPLKNLECGVQRRFHFPRKKYSPIAPRRARNGILFEFNLYSCRVPQK